jgi:hypothetical protein
MRTSSVRVRLLLELSLFGGKVAENSEPADENRRRGPKVSGGIASSARITSRTVIEPRGTKSPDIRLPIFSRERPKAVTKQGIERGP